MKVDADRFQKTELLFVYGTLMQEPVQMKLFGRQISGTADALEGFELVPLEIKDRKVVEISGNGYHTMASRTERDLDVIPGIVLQLRPGEIEIADSYEVSDVKRVRVILRSGNSAWAYLDARQSESDYEG